MASSNPHANTRVVVVSSNLSDSVNSSTSSHVPSTSSQSKHFQQQQHHRQQVLTAKSLFLGRQHDKEDKYKVLTSDVSQEKSSVPLPETVSMTSIESSGNIPIAPTPRERSGDDCNSSKGRFWFPFSLSHSSSFHQTKPQPIQPAIVRTSSFPNPNCPVVKSVSSIKKTMSIEDACADHPYLRSYGFNMFQVFRTDALNEEYSEYSVKQRSFPVVLVYAMFFTGSLLMAIFAPFILEKSHPHHDLIYALGTVSWIMNFIDAVLGWCVVYRQTNHCSISQGWFAQLIKRNGPSIQFYLLMAVSLGYCLRMIARTISGKCIENEYHRAGLLSEWNCNPYHDVDSLPMDTAMAMMFTPIAYPTVFRECRVDMIMFSFSLIVITFFVATYILHKTQPLFFISMYLFLVTFIAIESPRQSLSAFLTHKKFQRSLEENQKMAAQTEVEMRHVLGNVAHDFKTPLSSFMNGIDVIANTVEDFEQSLAKKQQELIPQREPFGPSTSSTKTTIPAGNSFAWILFEKEFQTFFRSMRMTLHDVRSTNSFMLMTINRCLDFTKVSKGMKLAPKLETIDLIETISLPIGCMKNIQNKVSLKVGNISDLVCSHIITDKQWLQENILCLLSNAVKYSSEGEVTISLSLQKYRNGNIPEEDEIPKTKVISVPKGSSLHGLDANGTTGNDGIKVVAEAPLVRSSSQTLKSTDPSLLEDGEPISSSSSSRNMPWYEDWWVTFKQLFRIKPRSTKIVPVIAYDHYVVPQEDQMTSLSLRRSRRLASTSASLRSATNKQRGHAFTTISQQGKGYLLIEVEDHGIGISDEDMQELFSPFKQTQRLAGGTGLGLFSLAKRIEAMHGSYGVKKRKDGQKGSLFWFSFPYRPDMLLAKSHGDGYAKARMHEINSAPTFLASGSTMEDNGDNKQHKPPQLEPSNSIPVLNSDNRGDSIPLIKTESTSTIVPKPSIRDKQLDILIAEDSPTIAKMVKMMLSRHGHKVTIAENGEIVLNRVTQRHENKSSPFDVILMDLQMPVMDGLEATRRLRKMEEEDHSGEPMRFKVIGLSANSEEDTTQQAFEAGIDSFIPKPFDIQSFYTVMEGLKDR